MLSALSKQEESGNEQLLRLYWNRAIVKRELKTLQAERHELLDKLKDQEDEIVRAKEQLDGLERLLVNPVAAANAMVYFQLRHIWRICAQRLQQLGADLATQRERRERAVLHEAALAKRQRRLDAINENLDLLEKNLKLADSDAQRLRQQLETMNFVLRFFLGPGIRKQIAELTETKSGVELRIQEARELSEKLQGEPLPEPDGLSVENRRIINTALIALAQHLALHFAENGLVALAKKATERTVGDMKFGDRRECDRMVEHIRDRIAQLEKEGRLAEHVRERANQLSRDLQYRDETVSVPSPFSTPTILAVVSSGGEARRETDTPVRINVLADDYFDLSHYMYH